MERRKIFDQLKHCQAGLSDEQALALVTENSLRVEGNGIPASAGRHGRYRVRETGRPHPGLTSHIPSDHASKISYQLEGPVQASGEKPRSQLELRAPNMTGTLSLRSAAVQSLPFDRVVSTTVFPENKKERLMEAAEKIFTQKVFQKIQPLLQRLFEVTNKYSQSLYERHLDEIRAAVNGFLEEYDQLAEQPSALKTLNEGLLNMDLHKLGELVYSLLHLDCVRFAMADKRSPQDVLLILATLQQRAKNMPAMRSARTVQDDGEVQGDKALSSLVAHSKAKILAVHSKCSSSGVPYEDAMSVHDSLCKTLQHCVKHSTSIQDLAALDLTRAAIALAPVLQAELCHSPELLFKQQLLGALRKMIYPKISGKVEGMTVFEQRRCLHMLIGPQSTKHVVDSAREISQAEWQLAIEESPMENQEVMERAIAVCMRPETFGQAQSKTQALVAQCSSAVVERIMKRLQTGLVNHPASPPQYDSAGQCVQAAKPGYLQVQMGGQLHAPSQACILLYTQEVGLSCLYEEDPTALAMLMTRQRRKIEDEVKPATLVTTSEGKSQVKGRNMGYGSVLHNDTNIDIYQQAVHSSLEMMPQEKMVKQARQRSGQTYTGDEDIISRGDQATD